MQKYIKDIHNVWKKVNEFNLDKSRDSSYLQRLKKKSKYRRVITDRYEIAFQELAPGGPAGYETEYIVEAGDPIPEDLYDIFLTQKGNLLPAIQKRLDSQRNISNLIEILRKGGSVGIASGFKPSGPYHFGHKLAAETLAFFQLNGVQIFCPIADVEAELDTKLSRKEYMYWAADNLLDWGACDVDLDAVHVYLQTEEKRSIDLIYSIAKGLTFDLAVDTYNMQKLVDNVPFLLAGLVQVTDILLPQHPEFGNELCLLVAGPDQDGHMKMTLELVERTKNVLLGFKMMPAALYIPHIRGLTGIKQSSRLEEEESTIYLGSGHSRLTLKERIDRARNKIRAAEREHDEEVKRFALDMIRYISDFEQYNKRDFVEIEKKIPTSLKREISQVSDKGIRRLKLDDYLIEKCLASGQDNVRIIKEYISEAIASHQKRKKEVFDYALERANGRHPKKPDFWKASEKAIVPEIRRNKTQWYHIIHEKKEELESVSMAV